MNRKIALEEHFATENTLSGSNGYLSDRVWPELSRRLLDVAELRLSEMDCSGIEMMILSLNSPAIQAIPDTSHAAEAARRANDYLAEAIAPHPLRFAALAALPMQDPDLAARELSRCITELGFRGALVNGYSQVGDAGTAVYYDAPQYLPFWSEVEQLGAPFYLHPRNPIPPLSHVYAGHPWMLGPTWAFGQETAAHALRLMGSGLFDCHPQLNVILGHLGETLPSALWRLDNRSHWTETPHLCPARRKIADYFRTNFHITTSGNFSTSTLLGAILEIGTDRIMFSVDYPFESCEDAASWLDATPISEADRAKIGRTNALKLFRLDDMRRER